jgi:hypothetical protein
MPANIPTPPLRPSRRFRQSLLVLLLAGVLGPGGVSHLAAQSCILTRLDSPTLNVFDPAFGDDDGSPSWLFSIGYRYGEGGRHFIGTEEQKERQREHSEVINTVHLLDVGIRRQFDDRNSLEIGIPFLMARREGPIRNDDRELIGRQVRSNTRGMGDVTAVFQHLLWAPSQHPRSNLALGIGIKLPTGANNVHDSQLVYRDGELVPEVVTADQSVQPGDGGWGLILQASGYHLLAPSGAVAGYASASYIIAPEGDSGTLTYRSAPEEAVMSIADQYVARLGVQIGPRTWKGLSLGLGGRIEGIPVHDLLGSSEGFRRPGYILALEPSLAVSRGRNTIQLSVPIAVERNHQRSVPDLARGRHGDASFPDYVVLAGYSRKF